MLETKAKPISELVDGLIARNDGSWREFLRLVGPLIKGLCHRSELSDDEVEDVAQSFVLKLLEKDCRALRGLRIAKEESFYGWVKVVVSRVIIDHAREGEARRDRELRSYGERFGEPLSGKAASEIETKVMLEQAIKELTPSERTLFRLDYSDLRDKEIARILGVRLDTAQQRLSRLRKKLRGILTGDVQESGM